MESRLPRSQNRPWLSIPRTMRRNSSCVEFGKGFSIDLYNGLCVLLTSLSLPRKLDIKMPCVDDSEMLIRSRTMNTRNKRFGSSNRTNGNSSLLSKFLKPWNNWGQRLSLPSPLKPCNAYRPRIPTNPTTQRSKIGSVLTLFHHTHFRML